MCIRDSLYGNAQEKNKSYTEKKDSESSADVSIDPNEARFLLIEGRLSRVEALCGDDSVDVIGEQQIPLYGSYEIYGETVFAPEVQKQTPRRGRSPEITPRDFANRRDRMVHLVESNWPDLEPILSRAYESPRELKRTLLLHFPEWKTDDAFKCLRGVGHPLWKYLAATKYLKPRKLAYAMTGVPELTWRSSLECCELKQPSKSPIHFNAMRNHIQDRHPKWFSLLLQEGIMPKTLKMLPEECRECERFIRRPDRIMAAIGRAPLPPNL